MVYKQVDGQTNNVTFKTDCIDVWKQVILAHLEVEQVSVIKEDTHVTVIKVSLNDDGQSHAPLTVKINIFNTTVYNQNASIQNFRCTTIQFRTSNATI